MFTRDLSGTGAERIQNWTGKTEGPALDPFRTGSRRPIRFDPFVTGSV